MREKALARLKEKRDKGRAGEVKLKLGQVRETPESLTAQGTPARVTHSCDVTTVTVTTVTRGHSLTHSLAGTSAR